MAKGAFVSGFLRMRSISPGRPDQGLPGGGEYPDQGLPGEGGDDLSPEHPIEEVPPPPPGIWPPPVPGHPIVPVPPGNATPPGTIWPPVGSPGQPLPSTKLWILAAIPGYGFKYVCIDASLLVPKPTPK